MAGQFYYNNVYINGQTTLGQTAEIYEPRAMMSLDSDSILSGTFWLNNNGVVIKNDLGEASYRVFDKDGNILGWISENSILPNAEGQYIITPISAQALSAYEHYILEVTIIYDSDEYVNYIGVNVTG